VPSQEIVGDLHDADYGDESRSVEWVVLEAPISPDVIATDETFKDFVHLTKRTELPLRAASFGFGSSFTPDTQNYCLTSILAEESAIICRQSLS